MAHSEKEWAEAKKKCRLNNEDIARAKRLGINPRSLIKNIPNKSEPWKLPVKDWLIEIEEKRASKSRKKGRGPKVSDEKKQTTLDGSLVRAMVYHGPGNIGPACIPEPVIEKPTDAVVRVTRAAICSSDLHIRDGYVPRAVQGVALGHEFTGIVESVGQEVRHIRVGDRVAVNCETFCGVCYFCRRGWVNNCTDPLGGWALGCRIHGGQAEKARIPFADNCLIPIPDPVSDEQALLTGDLLSTGYWATDIGGVSEGDVVAIIGAGPTGLCCAMLSRLRKPAGIVLIDTDRSRLTFAKENGLADVIVYPAEEDPASVIRGMTDGRGADVVMEVAGGEGTFDMAWGIARPNATVVIVAMYGEPQTLPLPDMYGKNLTFRTGGVDGSHCKEIMDLIASGELDATCLLTHSFTFDRIEEAYELFSERRDGVMKVIIMMPDV